MTLQLTKKHNFDMVFDSQKVFRLILDAMSNPGKAVSIKEYADKLFGCYPALMAVAMTLLDNETGFFVCENHSLADEIASMTLAGREKINDADFIFVSDLGYIDYAVENAKHGTLTDPQKSATVIIMDDSEPVYYMMLSGPGIAGCKELLVTQTVKDAIAVRDAQCYEYPQGIDLLFISDTGGMFAIPRLIRTEVQ